MDSVIDKLGYLDVGGVDKEYLDIEVYSVFDECFDKCCVVECIVSV